MPGPDDRSPGGPPRLPRTQADPGAGDPPSVQPEPDAPLGLGFIADRYVVEALVAQGGLARVYRVRHLRLGTVHALKVLDLPTPDFQARILREGRAQGGLQHPNVVAVTDVVEVQGVPGLIMEYVEGPTLETLLQQQRPPLDEAVRLGQQILRGVAAAHRVGLIHRDIKPSNVLIARGEEGPQAKVADFGLVKLILGDGSLDSPLGGGSGPLFRTRSGLPMGTPGYMAPEQIQDASRVDARADVFALGAVLYALLTGERAFQGRDPATLFAAVLRGSYRRPSEVAPEIPAALEAVIVAALSSDPQDRPPDAQALLEAWNAAAEAPASPAVAPPPPARRGRWVAMGGAGLGLLALGAWLTLDPGPGTADAPVLTRLDLPGPQLQPALSPDGLRLIASDGQDLHLLVVGEPGDTLLTGELEAAATAPALSRDGEALAYEAGGAIYLAGPGGEHPRVVVEEGHHPAFSPDGRTLAWTTRAAEPVGERTFSDSELWLTDVDGGEPRALLRSLNPLSPSFSPDGRFVAFTGWEGGFVAPALWLVPVEGGEPRKLTASEVLSPAWDPSGEAIWYLAQREGRTALERLPVDPVRGQATGEAERVAEIPAARGWGLSLAARAPRLAVSAVGPGSGADADIWLVDLR